ncbi:MAG: hypothetical protein M3P15_10170, partial [Actinomycetota bacterium]|nr:hypothetical protein [Actinomycetota bacterium]
DVFARRWRTSLRRLPTEDEARRELALAVLAGTDEVSAADVAGALGWRRKEAELVLTELAATGRVTQREDDGLQLWSA